MKESNTELNNIRYPSPLASGSSVSSLVFPDSSVGEKNPPAIQETPVRFLGREDLLEK